MRRMRVRAAIAENVHSRQHAINLGKKRFPLYINPGHLGGVSALAGPRARAELPMSARDLGQGFTTPGALTV